MVRLKFAIELNYDVGPQGCDFIFNMQAAHTRHQTVVTEKLDISQALVPDTYIDPVSRNRYFRLHAFPGALKVAYGATVDIEQYLADPSELVESNVSAIPLAVLPYLYPSRYCQSDRLHQFAVREFGHLWQGYGRVQAIRDWVNTHVVFKSNSTDGNTSAVDTIVEQSGVCRDFAHLMIALCRAVNIPARFATGIDYGADPILGPQDFHAYVEVFVGGRWYMFDPSGTAIPMGFVRLATGRDAADCAFATMFGGVNADQPIISIEAVANAKGEVIEPFHSTKALSTDAQY